MFVLSKHWVISWMISLKKKKKQTFHNCNIPSPYIQYRLHTHTPDWPTFRSANWINLTWLIKELRMKIKYSQLRSIKWEIYVLLHLKGYRPRHHNSTKWGISVNLLQVLLSYHTSVFVTRSGRQQHRIDGVN